MKLSSLRASSITATVLAPVLAFGLVLMAGIFQAHAKNAAALPSILNTSTYDELGRPISVKNGLNEVTSITYTRDTASNTETVVSTKVGTAVTDTTVTNALGQTISTKNANNETTAYYYNKRGENTGYLDPKNATFSFRYDARGRRGKRTEPDFTFQEYDYDPAGNLTRHRKADGSVATITYNTRNQPELKTWAGSAEFTDWAYDGQGRLTSIANQDATTAYTYYGTTNRVHTETTTKTMCPRKQCVHENNVSTKTMCQSVYRKN